MWYCVLGFLGDWRDMSKAIEHFCKLIRSADQKEVVKETEENREGCDSWKEAGHLHDDFGAAEGGSSQMCSGKWGVGTFLSWMF